MGFPWTVVSSENIHMPWHGVLHGLQCGYLLCHGPLGGWQRKSFSTNLLPVGCTGMSVLVPGACPPVLRLSPSCLQGCFSNSFLYSSLPMHHFALSLIHCYRGATILTDGPICVLWKVHLSCLELATSLWGSPWLTPCCQAPW